MRVAADRLLAQIGHWTPSRFAAAASVVVPDAPSAVPSHASWSDATPEVAGGTGRGALRNADVLYALAHRLADLGAGAEGRPPLPVPRLCDRALPDQIAVLTADLLAAEPVDAVLAAAAEALERARVVLR